MFVASQRRLGPRNSETSNLILDATEQVLRQEGYGAVSSVSYTHLTLPTSDLV